MPLRTVLTNLGSMGNIQPFLALGAELRGYGYDPVFALAPQYAAYVRNLGFEFVPVGPEIDYHSLQRRDTASELRGVNRSFFDGRERCDTTKMPVKTAF